MLGYLRKEHKELLTADATSGALQETVYSILAIAAFSAAAAAAAVSAAVVVESFDVVLA